MYKIFITEHFKKQLKVLCKKDFMLKDELIDSLENFNPMHSISISGNVYKIRLRKGNKESSSILLYETLSPTITLFSCPLIL